MNRQWLILAAMPLLFWSSGCGTKEVAASTREPLSVRAYKVDWHEFSEERRYAAVTEPAAQLDLAFRTAGVVTALYQTGGRGLEPGDRVPAGAVLAQLRVTEYQARTQAAEAQLADVQAGKAASEASVHEAEAAATQANQDFERAQALFAVQALTRADLDAVRARRDAADARLDAARRGVNSYSSRIESAIASHEESKVPLSDTTIRAPFDGVVVSRAIERGSSVAAGAVAYTLVDLRTIKLGFGITDTTLSQFAPGSKVRVTVDALPGQSFNGQILAVSPEADRVNRLFRATAAVANGQGLLKAGMVASVTRSLPEKTQALAIPLRAVRRLSDRSDDFAALVIANGTLQIRKVTLGSSLGDMIAVRSGLQVGDLVAEDAGMRITPGDPIRVIR
ncbi:MAG TPA: efflux RND transporter periplasmic adaptor subunit [Bryobacteraceae bacterium]|jgi:RND family efflux transporter MFP subunit